jgi:hypothetical protein
MTILLKGGDYLIALKDNQPTLHKQAQSKLAAQPPAYTREVESGHGRIEIRQLFRVELDEDISSFPQGRQLLGITRHYTTKTEDEFSTSEPETRYFITSLIWGECSPRQLTTFIRGHWSVENKNHWKRDASRWREDRSVRRKPRGAKNLALLRGALFCLIPTEEHSSINMAFEHYGANPALALHQLRKAHPARP